MADGQYLDLREFTVVTGRTPRQISPVVRTDNAPRTQNGHIRNDTRDVSRRIPAPRNVTICRKNCVSRDRACTRAPLPNFHGKEAVPGSSPGEGLNTCKTALFDNCRVPPD